MENNRSIVISLIKEDLRCNKLVLGLSDLGLDAGKYHTELSAVVFQLMELDHSNDALLQLYFECIDRATMIDDVEDTNKIVSAAEEILEKMLDAAKQ